MATLANDLAANLKPPAKTIVITIDDGWYDGFTYALPILESHDFVATYYVIASRIDQTDFLSSAELQGLVAAGDEIGDHTMDHANLTSLGAADLKSEIDVGASPDRAGHRRTGPSPWHIHPAMKTAGSSPPWTRARGCISRYRQANSGGPGARGSAEAPGASPGPPRRRPFRRMRHGQTAT